VWNGFDYELQVWVTNGIIQCCGHLESMHPQGRSCCNGHRLAGRSILDLSNAQRRDGGSDPNLLTEAMVYLKHPPAKPLRRGIPGTPYLIEISPTLITVKVQGSRRAGVSLPLIEVIRRLSTPETVPAKFHGDPMAYLEWVAKKKRKR
jgi:hypothetical protein